MIRRFKHPRKYPRGWPCTTENPNTNPVALSPFFFYHSLLRVFKGDECMRVLRGDIYTEVGLATIWFRREIKKKVNC